MKNLQKNYIETFQPKIKEEEFPVYSEKDFNEDNEIYSESETEEDSSSEETLIEELEYEEQTTLKITPSSNTDMVVVDTNTHENLSKLEGTRVRFVDFYKDARTFLEKANSTKFVLVSYILLSSPLLLILGYLSEDVYREILIIISLTYLGVDAYEKKTQVRKKKDS